VVSFAVRQGVLDGWVLWGPAGALLAVGLVLLALAVGAIRRIGTGAGAATRERQGLHETDAADDSPLAQRLRRRHIPPPGMQPR
jgi:voltage-gated potassium channel Kch